jgi:dihydrofolate reductase
VFVITHHERSPLEMSGGTTFHFVTDGVEAAVRLARAAAGDGDVAIAGGATTINQCLAAGIIDELRLHVAPFTSGLAGGGSRMFEGVPSVDFEIVSARHASHVTHLTYRRGAGGGGGVGRA